MAVGADSGRPAPPILYAAVAALGHGLAAGLLPALERLVLQLDTPVPREPLCACPMLRALPCGTLPSASTPWCPPKPTAAVSSCAHACLIQVH